MGILDMIGSKTALFVIDMQETYIGEKSKYGYDSKSLIEAVNRRIADVKTEGLLVVYVKNVVRRKTESFTPEFVQGLTIVSGHVVEKNDASVFSNARLYALLEEHSIAQIEMIGIDGNCCVAASALDAAHAGYTVQLPLQYIGIRNPGRFQKTREKLQKGGVVVID